MGDGGNFFNCRNGGKESYDKTLLISGSKLVFLCRFSHQVIYKREGHWMALDGAGLSPMGLVLLC